MEKSTMVYLPFVARRVFAVWTEGRFDGMTRSLAVGTGVNRPEDEAIMASAEGTSLLYC